MISLAFYLLSFLAKATFKNISQNIRQRGLRYLGLFYLPNSLTLRFAYEGQMTQHQSRLAERQSILIYSHEFVCLGKCRFGIGKTCQKMSFLCLFLPSLVQKPLHNKEQQFGNINHCLAIGNRYIIIRRKMGQGACCENNANDPTLTYYNGGKPIAVTTPVKATRRSQRDALSPRSSKYTQSPQPLEVSTYVKEKLKDLEKFEPRSGKKLGGEQRPAHFIESSGAMYRGEWKDEQPHGQGELVFKDGSYYVGTFANGFAHGEGRYIFSRGSYYQGQVRHNIAEGRGTLVNDSEGYKYVGQWLSDLPNGQGEEVWNDGTVYKGEFLNGNKHGKGHYRFPNGSAYDGYLKNDLFQGQGTLTLPQGEYKGTFNCGKMEGRGLFNWHDGSRYEGDYKNNRKHGKGKYLSSDGKEYEGSWEDGVRQGEGILTSEMGVSVGGTWNRGEYLSQ